MKKRTMLKIAVVGAAYLMRNEKAREKLRKQIVSFMDY